MYATLSREGEPSNAYSISSTFSEDEENILRQRKNILRQRYAFEPGADHPREATEPPQFCKAVKNPTPLELYCCLQMKS